MDIMLKNVFLSALAALAVSTGAALAAEEGHVTDYSFSFEGPFGAFDQAQLQRGLQVYTEVCAACHGLQYVAYRTLAQEGGPGMSEEQMRAYAAQFEVEDPQTGEYGPATPTDHFGASAIENAPDLSLMAKARAGFHGPYGLGLNQLFRGMGGAEYIASFVHRFTGEETEVGGVILYENSVKGGYVSMPPVLSDDLVTYEDGTPATVEQMSKDVAAFLMWTAEPKMMARKSAGMTAVLFLAGLTALLYMTNKQIWSPHKGGKKKV
jgi:ubiquinol-cytochrome c reductase cytochrome c1 subunit